MAVFKPPKASAGQCAGIPFGDAEDFAPEIKQLFDDFDQTPKGSGDPSKCKALLRFPGGCVFWSAKMAIDADGPAAGPGRLSGSQLDPASGQDKTSYRYPASQESLSSEAIPYIVLPGGSFRKAAGVDKGDVAAVVYQGRIAAAICGDVGPVKKIGEGSIRLHEAFHPPAHDPCSERNANGSCKLIWNASIEQDVLVFVFPDSGFGPELEPNNLEGLVKERAMGLFNRLKGV